MGNISVDHILSHLHFQAFMKKYRHYFEDIYFKSIFLLRKFKESFNTPWQDIEAIITAVWRFFYNWRFGLLILSTLVIVFWPNSNTINDNPLLFWEWGNQYIQIVPDSLAVTIDHPQFLAKNEDAHLEIVVQNEGTETFSVVRLTFWAENLSLRFKEGNEILIETLRPGEIYLASLPFRTARNIDGNDFNTYMRIWYQMEGNDNINSKYYGNLQPTMPVLRFNVWRQYWVDLNSSIAWLGVFGGLMLVLITFRGRLSELIKSILPNFLKKDLSGNRD